MDTPDTQGQTGDPNPEKNKSLPKEVSLKYNVNPIDNLTNAINNQTKSREIENNSPNSIGNRQVIAQDKGNKIARWAMLFNIVLGGVTIWALVLNSKAVKQATIAADAATRAADAATRADSIYLATLTWDTTKTAIDRRMEGERFQKSYNTANRQYGDLNRSRITVGRIEYYYPQGTPDDSLTAGKARQLTLYIYNIGPHIVWFESYKYKCIFSTDPRKIKELIREMKGAASTYENKYLRTDEVRLINIPVFDSLVTHQQAASIKKDHNCTLYFEAEYFNEVLQKSSSLVYVVEIKDHVKEPNTTPRKSLFNYLIFMRTADSIAKGRNP